MKGSPRFWWPTFLACALALVVLMAVAILQLVFGGMVRDVLLETGGNKAETARRLGIAKTNLYRRLERYGIPYDKRNYGTDRILDSLTQTILELLQICPKSIATSLPDSAWENLGDNTLRCSCHRR